jgi:hypothetical protein
MTTMPDTSCERLYLTLTVALLMACVANVALVCAWLWTSETRLAFRKSPAACVPGENRKKRTIGRSRGGRALAAT